MPAGKLKVLVLADKRLAPKTFAKRALTTKSSKWQMEADVIKALYHLGYEVRLAPVLDQIGIIISEIERFKPNIVFNLLEEFNYNPKLEAHIASLLEMLGVRFTGSNALALANCKDKLLAKKIIASSDVTKYPEYICLDKIDKKALYKFPLIVKARSEEGSFGLSQKSVVNNISELKKQIKLLKNKYKTEPIVEEYIAGRELYVGIIGSNKLKAFPIWEFIVSKSNNYNIATRQAKWNKHYQKKIGVVTKQARGLSKRLEANIKQQAINIYRELKITGYARIDFRLTEDNQLYFIEANPNPNLAKNEDFARSAMRSGYSYEKLIEEIIKNS